MLSAKLGADMFTNGEKYTQETCVEGCFFSHNAPNVVSTKVSLVCDNFLFHCSIFENLSARDNEDTVLMSGVNQYGWGTVTN